MGENTAVKLLMAQLKGARHTLAGTIAGVTEEQLHFLPPGTANPISGQYAHIIFGEDSFVQMRLKGATPLYASTWSDKTGLSALMPAPGEPGSEEKRAEWLKTVRIDLERFKAYEMAVHEATDTYLAGLQDDDLSGEVDLGLLGKRTVGGVLSLIVSHQNNHIGEISALKGIQGLKGYPF